MLNRLSRVCVIESRSSRRSRTLHRPFSFETPIFAAVLVAIFIGFLLGGFVSFISASRGLLRNRQLSKALENAKREELILKNEVRKFELAAADQSPRSKIQL